MNITGLQFFGRDDPAVQEFFESNDLFVDSPIQNSERSLRVRFFFLRKQFSNRFSLGFSRVDLRFGLFFCSSVTKFH